MKRWGLSLQIAFTFIGTVVGAGFATGREVMQFFTRFGHWGALMILVSTSLFVWLGSKMMLTAAEIKAKSFEDMNRHLFGDRAGQWVSHLMLIVMLGVNSVMLAGAGSVFSEHLNLGYQTGLLVTMFACFFLLRQGMSAILTINSVVVPLMMVFTSMLVVHALNGPGADRWLTLETDHSPWAAWMSPLLYAAFNLSMSQAVLVPLGNAVSDPVVLKRGAWLGGVGIGVMLLAGHLTLSSRMPGVRQYDIPMGGIAREVGPWIHWIFVLLIFMEIFTTLVADIYGLTLQLQERIHVGKMWLTLGVLLFCYAAGQFGFGPLLTTLYPMFGMLSLGWLLLMGKDDRLRPRPPTFPSS
ncbi:YkvI family membrane protein [Cohnella thailandensis]|uniref:Membrane protein YkvI n=1 Tax=Cohnella thailandensis TaxID=557557 RepID=A0A841T0Y8_9BACL|nr:hypothetical protein [Cohnella thailandensis]MBB6634731.1 hypothetical protein [Cohnella thailandensis]MBP1972712.1 putative membrane protein YkvI [Cohnella thailandensis]